MSAITSARTRMPASVVARIAAIRFARDCIVPTPRPLLLRHRGRLLFRPLGVNRARLVLPLDLFDPGTLYRDLRRIPRRRRPSQPLDLVLVIEWIADRRISGGAAATSKRKVKAAAHPGLGEEQGLSVELNS
jgi:hypothetical protein